MFRNLAKNPCDTTITENQYGQLEHIFKQSMSDLKQRLELLIIDRRSAL